MRCIISLFIFPYLYSINYSVYLLNSTHIIPIKGNIIICLFFFWFLYLFNSFWLHFTFFFTNHILQLINSAYLGSSGKKNNIKRYQQYCQIYCEKSLTHQMVLFFQGWSSLEGCGHAHLRPQLRQPFLGAPVHRALKQHGQDGTGGLYDRPGQGIQHAWGRRALHLGENVQGPQTENRQRTSGECKRFDKYLVRSICIAVIIVLSFV